MPLNLGMIVGKEIEKKIGKVTVTGVMDLIRGVGKKLPTTRYAKMEPVKKFEHLTGWQFVDSLPIWMRRNKVSDMKSLGDKLTGGQMDPILRKLFGSTYPYAHVTNVNEVVVACTRAMLEVVFTKRIGAPLNRILVQQQTSSLTPVNAWRKFLWGKAGVLKGRETYQRRLLSNILRGGGFSSPSEGAWTIWGWVVSATAMWTLVEGMKAWSGQGSTPVIIEVDRTGKSTGSGSQTGGQSGVVPYGGRWGFGTNLLIKPSGSASLNLGGGLLIQQVMQRGGYVLSCDVCHTLRFFDSMAWMNYIITFPWGPHAWCGRCHTWTPHTARRIY